MHEPVAAPPSAQREGRASGQAARAWSWSSTISGARRGDTVELVAGLESALAGEAVVAPLPHDAQAVLAALQPEIAPEIDAGVVVATSGSTGSPRLVLLPTRAVLAAAAATHARLGGPGDWVSVLPVHHVAGLMTVARAVAAGTSVSYGSPDLSDLPRPSGRTYLSVVGAQLWPALDDPELVARLRDYAAVLLGGSAANPTLLERCREAGIPVVTTYGMAETCGGCVYDGRPLEGVEVSFVDGERIALAGPMAFSGYRLDPAATSEVLDGFTVLTRDRGRLAADGRLQVTGRIDDVVVSGGMNVDLAEAQRISEARLGPPEAGGPVLLAIPDPRWGSRIVAVTTAATGLDEVMAALRDGLRPAALPRELRRVSRLAYTPTGKIDSVALRRDWERLDSRGGELRGTDGDAG